jgi:hypothetical protein
VLLGELVHALVVGELDGVAVWVADHADVTDRLRQLHRGSGEPSALLGDRRDRVDVAALRDLEPEMRERSERRGFRVLVRLVTGKNWANTRMNGVSGASG